MGTAHQLQWEAPPPPATRVAIMLGIVGFFSFWLAWLTACCLVTAVRRRLLASAPASDVEWKYGSCAVLNVCCTASRLLERLGVRGETYRLCALLPAEAATEPAAPATPEAMGRGREAPPSTPTPREATRQPAPPTSPAPQQRLRRQTSSRVKNNEELRYSRVR